MEDRADEVGQAGERQLRLGLERPDVQDGEAGRGLRCVGEQGRLADARLAADDERRARAGARPGDQALEPGELVVPTEKVASRRLRAPLRTSLGESPLRTRALRHIKAAGHGHGVDRPSLVEHEARAV